MPLFSSFLLSVASILTLFLLVVAAPLRAADAPPAGLPHTLALPAGALAYRAIWTETILHDKAGQPQATISTTAYLREGVPNAAMRPVLFAFNGGPGASSSPLHTGLLGPRLAGKADAQGRRIFTDNPDTLLDIADIVLIDPVGTGFNRELQPGGMQAYLNVDGDAAATQAVIRTWLTQHGRTASPVFIAGESYGGYRLATMVRTMADLNIRGIVLISPALDFSVSPDQRFIFELPSLAAAAFAHGKVNQASRTVEQVFDEARAYAQGDYAVALQQGDLLAPGDRARVAKRVAAMVGLPAATIEKNDLRMPTQAFVEQLVPGSVLGRIDTRVVAPKPEKALVAGRSKAADDPALGMGKSNVIKSSALRDYLVEATGWQGERDYVSLSLDLNFAWDWRGRSAKFEDNTPMQATPGLVAFMQAKPQARLLLMGAYYDLATPWLGQQYALTHSGLPQERIAMQAFAAGHAVYDENTRASAAQLLRRFIGQAQ